MNKILIGIIVVLVLGGGVYIYMQSQETTSYEKELETLQKEVAEQKEDALEEVEKIKEDIVDAAEEAKDKSQTVIGQSVKGEDIIAYHFGEGRKKKALFVGGIHGGYSPGTSLVGFELVDYLRSNPKVIPEDVEVTVIPVMNPDGLALVTGSPDRFTLSDISESEAVRIKGRFNANEVDLNRNFDCQWQESGTWKSQSVSGGSAEFSEPESDSVRKYVREFKPDAVVVYYAAGGGVYASNCGGDTMEETVALTNLYAKASGYAAHEVFDFYEVTGDMVNWLASEKIPAISVLLTTHNNPEWTKNKKGIEAVLKSLAL